MLDEGRDTDLSLPRSWQKYDVNRANAFYRSSHDFIWQGTGNNEGNVGHALYEFYTPGTKAFKYGAGVELQAFCGSEMNCPIPF